MCKKCQSDFKVGERFWKSLVKSKIPKSLVSIIDFLKESSTLGSRLPRTVKKSYWRKTGYPGGLGQVRT